MRYLREDLAKLAIEKGWEFKGYEYERLVKEFPEGETELEFFLDDGRLVNSFRNEGEYIWVETNEDECLLEDLNYSETLEVCKKLNIALTDTLDTIAGRYREKGYYILPMLDRFHSSFFVKVFQIIPNGINTKLYYKQGLESYDEAIEVGIEYLLNNYD